MNNKSLGKKILNFIGNNSVPILFILICVVCIPISGRAFFGTRRSRISQLRGIAIRSSATALASSDTFP